LAEAANAGRTAIPLSIIDVEKEYGGFRALDRVSLEVEAGEFLTLLGPSGSGKTTLLMVLAGFVRPSAGRVLLGGQDIVRSPPHKRGIGMMFQNYALFPHKTVGENIAYPLWVRGVPRRERRARVEEALELVRLPGYGERRIDALSGGQRQRVALARATVFRPQVLLMDEPLSALDKRLREQMQGELRALHRTLGMTTICVTHDQREALTMSDRIAVMNAGRIVQHDRPQAIYERPADAFVADFIGESVLLPVETRGGEAFFRDQPLMLREAVQRDGAHSLMIRPEKLRLVEGKAPPEANVFPARVTGTVYEGESLLLELALAEGATLRLRRLLQHAEGEAWPEPGAEVRVALHRRDSGLVAGTAP